MKVIKFILSIIGSVAFLVWRQWIDVYHLVVVTPIGLIAFIIFIFIQRYRDRVADEEGDEEEEGSPFNQVIIGIILAAIVAGVMSLSIWIANMTPLQSRFYDRDRIAFNHDLELLKGGPAAGDENWAEYERRVRERLEMGVSPEWETELNRQIYDALVGEADMAYGDAKLAKYEEAKKWALDHGFDPRSAEDGLKLNLPTATPWPTRTLAPTMTPTITPTPTFVPTQTPLPTYTPQATYTPFPTPTGQPTLEAGYTDCVNAQFVEQQDIAANQILRLYDCEGDTLYKVEWLTAADDWHEAKLYSSLVREDGKDKAAFIRANGTIYVYVVHGHMLVSDKPLSNPYKGGI